MLCQLTWHTWMPAFDFSTSMQITPCKKVQIKDATLGWGYVVSRERWTCSSCVLSAIWNQLNKDRFCFTPLALSGELQPITGACEFMYVEEARAHFLHESHSLVIEPEQQFLKGRLQFYSRFLGAILAGESWLVDRNHTLNILHTTGTVTIKWKRNSWKIPAT